MLTLQTMKIGLYRHYKNKRLYQVIGIAHESDTQQKMVVYRGLYSPEDLLAEYGEFPLFVRAYTIFNEMVEVDGVMVPRFTYVEEAK